MTERELFDRQRVEEIGAMAADQPLQTLTKEWFLASCRHHYSYNFTWLGQPIIQYPQDVLAMQEIVWRVRPDVIVETGVAHGGSLLLYASLLELTGKPGRWWLASTSTFDPTIGERSNSTHWPTASL